MATSRFSHLDDEGRARMVDIAGKPSSVREAVASGWVEMRPETLQRVRDGQAKKGDVLAVAQVAGVMAAKRTWDLVPLCHPIPLTGVSLRFHLDEARHRIEIEATVKTEAATGVEMEALTAVTVAGLTIYDMCKAYDREMVLGEVRLVRKTGGRSGTYERRNEARTDRSVGDGGE